MRVMLVVDVKDEDLRDSGAVHYEDVEDALVARLGECYPDGGFARVRTLAAADVSGEDVLDVLLASAEVGLDGYDDAGIGGYAEGAVDKAWDARMSLERGALGGHPLVEG